jgi:hypothetical protein
VTLFWGEAKKTIVRLTSPTAGHREKSGSGIPAQPKGLAKRPQAKSQKAHVESCDRTVENTAEERQGTDYQKNQNRLGHGSSTPATH